MSSSVVMLRDVHKFYGKVAAVDGISLTAEKGEILTLLGPSGCGKTTTLRVIAGLEKVDKGEVFIEQKLVSSGEKHLHVPPEKRGIGIVFQSYALWPHMNVFGNVAYPLKLRRVSPKTIQEKVEAVLALVGLSGLEKREISQLSGGQQQRVALARALVFDPQILLLDEPLSNLDAKLRGQMRFELKALQRRLGLTTIFVTHDQSEAMAISDRIAVLNKGRVEQIGDPVEMYERPTNPFVADFVGATNLFDAEIMEEIVEGRYYVARVPGAEGLLYCAPPEGLKKGEPVVLSVKPGHVKVWPGERPLGKPNIWEAQVKSIAYLGEQSEYQLSVGHLSLRAVTPSLNCLLGDTVFVHIEPENIIRLVSKE